MGAADGWWLSVRTRMGEEFFAAGALKRRGFEVFAPWWARETKVFKRTHLEMTAFFPGYIFARMGAGLSVFKARQAEGVVSISARDREVLYVSPAVMAKVMERFCVDGYAPPLNRAEREMDPIHPGALVMVKAGPFAGFIAEVEALDSGGKLHLILHLFGRSTRLECPRADVSPTKCSEDRQAGGSELEQDGPASQPLTPSSPRRADEPARLMESHGVRQP